jgi:WD40 repeat protein/serine/threonine protein kinase
MSDGSCCPDRDTLQKLVLGLLPDAEATPLENHLESCSHCAQVLSEARVRDALTRQLQEGHAAAAVIPRGAVVEELIQKVNSLQASSGDSPTRTRTATGESQWPFGQIPPPAQIPAGLVNLGPYRIAGVIGAGGMGTVFAAEDSKLRRTVALKILQPTRAGDPTARERFMREARAVAAVNHDNIVSIYAVDEDHGVLYLVMPMLAGESLQSRLDREGKLPPREVVRLGQQIAEGLAAAHKCGLIHRDIKPSNVWLEEQPDGWRAKILDFGLARLEQDNALMTSDGVILGTPAYMAPEQARRQDVDARADLFSLGCVLYRATTGQLPFPAADSLSTLLARFMDEPPAPVELDPLVPVALSELIMRLLAREPANRPACARVVSEMLNTLEHGVTTEFKSPVHKPKRSRQRVFWGVVAALGLVVGAAAVFFQDSLHRLMHPDTPQVKSDEPVSPATPGTPAVPFVHTALDDLRRENIDPYELRIAGRGEADKAPAALVAVLGDSRLNDTWPIAFSPDDKTLVTSCGDRFIRAWDTETGEERRRYPTDANRGAFSPDGTLLALWLTDGTVKILDAVDWKEVKTIQPVQWSYWFLAFSPDSKLLATSSPDNVATIWDVKTWKKIQSINLGNTNAVAFRDGSQTLVAAADGCLKLFDVATGQLHDNYKGMPSFEWPAFSADGQLYLRSTAEKLGVIDTASGDEKTVLQSKGDYILRRGAFSFDGRLVAAAGRDNVVKVWDVGSGKQLHKFSGHRHSRFTSVTGLAFSHDGKLLASGGDDGRTRIWELTTGNERCSPRAHSRSVNSVSINRDGNVLASGGEDSTIRLWNLTTGKVDVLRDHLDCVYTVAFSPDGRTLASASRDHTVRLWGVNERLLGLHGDMVLTVAWSPDGDAVASGSLDSTAIIWDVNSDARKVFPRPRRNHFVAFSPDGKTLAASSADGIQEVQLWDVAKTRPTGMLRGGSCIAFNPDGMTVITAKPYLVQIWDLTSQQETKRLLGPEAVPAISISPDGRWLALTDNLDCKLWLWDLKLDQPVPRTVLFGARTLGISFSSDSRHVAVGHGNGTTSILRMSLLP